MKYLLLTLMIVAAPICAQQEKKEQPVQQLEQKLFTIRYADVNSLFNALMMFGGSIRPNPELRILAVSAAPQTMTAIEDAIKRLDVPDSAPKNVDLTGYIVLASEQGSSPALPAELESAIKQLRGVFAYKSFRLLDSLVIRGRSGQSVEAFGNLVGLLPDVNHPSPYQFRARVNSVTATDKGRVVQLDNLRMGIGDNRGGPNASIQTVVDIREGQKVIVGKTGLNGPGQAIILVLTAKVVD